MKWESLIGGDQPKDTVLNSLMQIPKRDDKQYHARFEVIEPNISQQADLLFMPDDKKYKYILVVVDIGSRLLDAEPLQDKKTSSVKTGFERIYKRAILKIPQILSVDGGTEFKAEVKKYLNDKDIRVKINKPGRHKQQALVERYNQIIGAYLFKRMTAQELLTSQPSVEWVDYLPSLIKYINKKATTRRKKAISKQKFDNFPTDKTTEILQIGTKVRVKLDHPINAATGEKLSGRFRTTDMRWDPRPRIIKEVLLKPYQPVLYLLDDPKKNSEFEKIGYSRNELQVISKNETHYKGRDIIAGKPKTFIVDQILGKKKIKNKVYYKVSWVGYDDPKDQTYELRSKLLEDVPDVVKEYEKHH